jgi:hypothetical protein
MSKRSVAFVGVLILMVMIGSAVIGAVSGIASRSSANGPSKVFLPLVMKAMKLIPTSGSGVLYVFPTTTTTAGSPSAWRAGMHDICIVEDPESHFCSLEEIEHAWVTTGVQFEHMPSVSWLDTASLATLVDPVNGTSEWNITVGSKANCDGWRSTDPADEGTILMGNGLGPYTENCDVVLPVACCKHLP